MTPEEILNHAENVLEVYRSRLNDALDAQRMAKQNVDRYQQIYEKQLKMIEQLEIDYKLQKEE